VGKNQNKYKKKDGKGREALGVGNSDMTLSQEKDGWEVMIVLSLA
jgi:hypothetical protein